MAAKKYIPIIHICSSLNYRRTHHIMRKIESASKMNNLGLAVIVDISNQMPVQVDSIARLLRDIRRRYDYPIYGFTTRFCSTQSYYLLSTATHLYTTPITLFNLGPLGGTAFSPVLSHIGIHKHTSRSQENLVGKTMDSFAYPISASYWKPNDPQINDRIIKYSLQNRQEVIQEDEEKDSLRQLRAQEIRTLRQYSKQLDDLFRVGLWKRRVGLWKRRVGLWKRRVGLWKRRVGLQSKREEPDLQEAEQNLPVRDKRRPMKPESEIVMGEDMVKKYNLADGLGTYEETLKKIHPDANLLHIQSSKEDFAIGKIAAIISSPFLVMLFFFKVALKYTIVMYLYVRAKVKGEDKTFEELEKEAQQVLDGESIFDSES